MELDLLLDLDRPDCETPERRFPVFRLLAARFNCGRLLLLLVRVGVRMVPVLVGVRVGVRVGTDFQLFPWRLCQPLSDRL